MDNLTHKVAEAIKRGDVVTYDRIIGMDEYGTLQFKQSLPMKVMTVSDGYAMIRYHRAMPTVQPVRALSRISTKQNKEE